MIERLETEESGTNQQKQVRQDLAVKPKTYYDANYRHESVNSENKTNNSGSLYKDKSLLAISSTDRNRFVMGDFWDGDTGERQNLQM